MKTLDASRFFWFIFLPFPGTSLKLSSSFISIIRDWGFLLYSTQWPQHILSRPNAGLLFND